MVLQTEEKRTFGVDQISYIRYPPEVGVLLRTILKNETKQAISDIPSKMAYLGCQKGQFFECSTDLKVIANKLSQITSSMFICLG